MIHSMVGRASVFETGAGVLNPIGLPWWSKLQIICSDFIKSELEYSAAPFLLKNFYIWEFHRFTVNIPQFFRGGIAQLGERLLRM